MLNPLCSRALGLALFVVSVVGFVASSAAQQGPRSGSASSAKPVVELSTTQIETNNRAVGLLSETPPRAKEAIKLVEAALLMEVQADLLHLTLGRAYQLDGQCARSEAQFEAAEQAPGVVGVPPDFVAAQLERYRAELERCAGVLKVECEPPDLVLKLDGEPLECASELRLEPGTYTVDGTHPEASASVSLPIQIVGGRVTESKVRLATSPQGRGEAATPAVSASEASEPSLGATHRLSPVVSFGVTTNVIEDQAQAFLQPEQSVARYPTFADSTLLGTAGLEGRSLWGRSGSARGLSYGLGYSARIGRSLGADFNFDQSATSALTYLHAELIAEPQLWWRGRFGIYGAAALRRRLFDVGFIARDAQGGATFPQDDPSGSGIRADEYDSTSWAFGGGGRLELGDWVGLPALEVWVGAMAPLFGTPWRAHGPEIDPFESDEEAPGVLLPLDLGVRAQLDRVVLKLGYNAWYDEMISARCELNVTRGCPNLRASQLLLSAGWTFGEVGSRRP